MLHPNQVRTQSYTNISTATLQVKQLPVEESPEIYVLRGRLRAGSMEGQYVVAAVIAAVGESIGAELVAADGNPAVAAETPAGEAVVGEAVTDAAAAATAPKVVGRLIGCVGDFRRR